jgi:hypothetical protein
MVRLPTERDHAGSDATTFQMPCAALVFYSRDSLLMYCSLISAASCIQLEPSLPRKRYPTLQTVPWRHRSHQLRTQIDSRPSAGCVHGSELTCLALNRVVSMTDCQTVRWRRMSTACFSCIALRLASAIYATTQPIPFTQQPPCITFLPSFCLARVADPGM